MSIFGTIATASGGGAPGSGITAVAGSLNVSTGDLLVAVAVGSNGIGTTCSFSDTIGNTFTVIGSPSVSSNANSAGSIFIGYCLASSGTNATNVITATFGANQVSFRWIFVWKVPLSGSAIFDVSNLKVSSSSGNAPTSGSFTTTGSDELVLVAAGNDFTGITYTQGTGYTLDSSGFVNKVGGAQHRLFSSAQSGITAAFSQSSSTDWNIAVVAFKANAAAASGSVQVILMF